MCCGAHVLQVFVREVAAFLVCVCARTAKCPSDRVLLVGGTQSVKQTFR